MLTLEGVRGQKMDRILEIDIERDDDYDLLPSDPVTGHGARISSEMNDVGDTKDDEFDDFDENDFDDDFDDDFEEELDDDEDEFDLDDDDFDNVEFDDEELDEEELTEDFDEDEEPAGGDVAQDDPAGLDGEE
jgi:hypothetical protein